MTRIQRREFLKRTALAAAAFSLTDRVAAGASAPSISIVVDPADPIASAGPSVWAASQLERALAARGVIVHRRESLDQSAGDFTILAAGSNALTARPILEHVRVKFPDAPEALCLAPGSARAPDSGQTVLLACGSDARGLEYALLELADRVSYTAEPMDALAIQKVIVEQPVNAVRGIMRCFESDVEDKPWFYDRAMWEEYFSMLAAQRFNRFNFTLGLGYNLPRNLTDVYFYFPYPFFVTVPGYDVRAVPLPDAERDRNLATLQFMGEQAAKRGIDFRIGIWTHAYQWTNSPNANYTITGLTPETHAAYCRDALTTLLKACPAISGVTFRIHGESGIPEGSYDFWQTVFEGIVRCGRRVEIDMHAGNGSEDDRYCPRNRIARQHLAEMLGRAPGPGLSSSRNPRDGYGRTPSGEQPDSGQFFSNHGDQQWRASLPALQLWRSAERKARLHRALPRVARHAAHIVVGRSTDCRGLWPPRKFLRRHWRGGF